MINLSFPGIIPLRRRNYEPSLHSILYFNTQIVIFTASTDRENQTVDISNNKKKTSWPWILSVLFSSIKESHLNFFFWLNPVRKWIPINYRYLHMTQKIHMHKIFKKKKKQFLSLYINQVSSAFFFCFYALSHRKLTYKSKYCDITSL